MGSCKRAYTRYSDLLAHEREQEEREDRKYMCIHCGEEFMERKELLKCLAGHNMEKKGGEMGMGKDMEEGK